MQGYITFPAIDGATRADLEGNWAWRCSSDYVARLLASAVRRGDWSPSFGEPAAWMLAEAAKILGGKTFHNPPPEREPGIIH